MGKGDRKTKRGKLFKGTYGVRRPRKSAKKAFKTEKPKETKAKNTIKKSD